MTTEMQLQKISINNLILQLKYDVKVTHIIFLNRYNIYKKSKHDDVLA